MNGSKSLEQYLPPNRNNKPSKGPVFLKLTKKEWTGTIPEKTLAVLTELVSEEMISCDINALSSFHTRHTKSPYINQVADWIKSRFTQMGYTDILDQHFTREDTDLRNIIAKKKGSGITEEAILICAHFDCRMEELSDAVTKAPGADDNASGMAAMLELARIIAGVNVVEDVYFAAFSGEEQGFWGATACSQYIKDKCINLQQVINLDMIGYAPDGKSIYVEQDMGNEVESNDKPSQLFAAKMAQMGADYTDLSVSLGGIYESDYMPFEARGYVCVGAYEGEENPFYHSINDTVEYVNISFVAKVAKMVLATVCHEALKFSDIPKTDIFIRDNESDNGNQPGLSPHWASPDIWVRNTLPEKENNVKLEHQVPIKGIPNYLYVRVHNRSDMTVNSYAVTAFHSNPSTGMIWPDDFTEIGLLVYTKPIAPGQSAIAGPFVWTPQFQEHECLMAIASTPEDKPVPDFYSGKLDHSILVRYDNNVGQRNVSPVASVPCGKIKFTIKMHGNVFLSRNRLEINACELPEDTIISIAIPFWLYKSSKLTEIECFAQNHKTAYLRMHGGKTGLIENLFLPINKKISAKFIVDFSKDAENMKVYPLIISQFRKNNDVVGKYTVNITAVKENDDWLYGNLRTMQVHMLKCRHHKNKNPLNLIPISSIADAKLRGFGICEFCLSDRKQN